MSFQFTLNGHFEGPEAKDKEEKVLEACEQFFHVMVENFDLKTGANYDGISYAMWSGQFTGPKNMYQVEADDQAAGA